MKIEDDEIHDIILEVTGYNISNRYLEFYPNLAVTATRFLDVKLLKTFSMDEEHLLIEEVNKFVSMENRMNIVKDFLLTFNIDTVGSNPESSKVLLELIEIVEWDDFNREKDALLAKISFDLSSIKDGLDNELKTLIKVPETLTSLEIQNDIKTFTGICISIFDIENHKEFRNSMSTTIPNVLNAKTRGNALVDLHHTVGQFTSIVNRRCLITKQIDSLYFPLKNPKNLLQWEKDIRLLINISSWDSFNMGREITIKKIESTIMDRTADTEKEKVPLQKVDFKDLEQYIFDVAGILICSNDIFYSASLTKIVTEFSQCDRTEFGDELFSDRIRKFISSVNNKRGFVGVDLGKIENVPSELVEKGWEICKEPDWINFNSKREELLEEIKRAKESPYRKYSTSDIREAISAILGIVIPIRDIVNSPMLIKKTQKALRLESADNKEELREYVNRFTTDLGKRRMLINEDILKYKINSESQNFLQNISTSLSWDEFCKQRKAIINGANSMNNSESFLEIIKEKLERLNSKIEVTIVNPEFLTVKLNRVFNGFAKNGELSSEMKDFLW